MDLKREPREEPLTWSFFEMNRHCSHSRRLRFDLFPLLDFRCTTPWFIGDEVGMFWQTDMSSGDSPNKLNRHTFSARTSHKPERLTIRQFVELFLFQVANTSVIISYSRIGLSVTEMLLPRA